MLYVCMSVGLCSCVSVCLCMCLCPPVCRLCLCLRVCVCVSLSLSLSLRLSLSLSRAVPLSPPPSQIHPPLSSCYVHVLNVEAVQADALVENALTQLGPVRVDAERLDYGVVHLDAKLLAVKRQLAALSPGKGNLVATTPRVSKQTTQHVNKQCRLQNGVTSERETVDSRRRQTTRQKEVGRDTGQQTRRR